MASAKVGAIRAAKRYHLRSHATILNLGIEPFLIGRIFHDAPSGWSILLFLDNGDLELRSASTRHLVAQAGTCLASWKMLASAAGISVIAIPEAQGLGSFGKFAAGMAEAIVLGKQREPRIGVS